MTWFDIPNEASATFAPQAAMDSTDIDIITLGIMGTGVSFGCAVSPQGSPNMTVQVASGGVTFGSSAASVSTVASLTIGAAGASDRKDMIVVSSAGVVSVVAGGSSGAVNGVTAAGGRDPVKGAIPANSVVLAEVYVATTTTSITSANIIDKRFWLSATFANGNSAQTTYATKAPNPSMTYENITSATATNVVQNPGGLMFFGTYWNGAASTTWGSAISSAVDGTSGATRMFLDAGTTEITGALQVGIKKTVSGSVSMPATVNHATVLGSFSSPAGSMALRFHLHQTYVGGQKTKTYEFVVDTLTDTTNTYYKLLPADQSATQQTAAEDFYLMCYRASTATPTWQFWVISPGTFPVSATVFWSAESYGDTAVTYSSTNATTFAATLPFSSPLHPSNFLDTVAGMVCIGTDNPPVANAPLTVYSNISGGSSIGVFAAPSLQNAEIMFLANGQSSGSPTIVGQAGLGGNILSDTAQYDLAVAAMSGQTLRLGVTGSASMIRVTGSDAQINDNGTARTIPRGLIYDSGEIVNASPPTNASTSTMVLVTGLADFGAITFTNGIKYRISVDICYANSVATDGMSLGLVDGGASPPTVSTTTTKIWRLPSNGVTTTGHHCVFYTFTGNGAVHHFGLVFRAIGGGTATATSTSTTDGQSRVIIEAIG